MMTEKPISPYLLGAGIVQGLRVTRLLDQNIVLESGYGYGSDGLPFFCEGATYYHYKLLNPTDDIELVVIIEYFAKRLKTPVDNLKIWELQTEMDYAAANNKLPLRVLKPQNTVDTEGSIFLDDKVVVAYRSTVETRVRILLMLKKDVAAFTFPSSFQWKDVLTNNENGESPFSIWGNAVASDPSKEVTEHDLYLHLNPSVQLPVLAIRRFGYADLKLEDFACDTPYQSIFCRTDDKKLHVLTNVDPYTVFGCVCTEYATIIDTIRREMELAITAFNTHFAPIVGSFAVSTLDAFWEALNARWCAFKEQQVATDKTAMQYWYGLFGDLATAYNELRNEALRLNRSKAVEPLAFNRHLLLGSLPAEPSLALPSPFRTAFQQAPIFNNQAEQWQRVCFLHSRLVVMMKCFYAPNYEWDDTATDSILTPSADVNADNEAGITAKINMPIRLTPSGPLSIPLGIGILTPHSRIGQTQFCPITQRTKPHL
jgi:hypothetical protein